MIIPPLNATIDRRLLLNYRVDPEALEPYLRGDNIRLRLIDGKAIAGICLIRLTQLRPTISPFSFGLSAENAAHRFGIIRTDENGVETPGVYIPERHTTSWLAKFAGGKVFPGIHHHATFEVDEGSGSYHVTMHSRGSEIEVRAHKSDQWRSKAFATPEEASDFFKEAPVGYSPRARGTDIDGVELITPKWATVPLMLDEVRSSFYDALPAGSVELDDALLMENIASEWRKAPSRSRAPSNPSRVGAGAMANTIR